MKTIKTAKYKELFEGMNLTSEERDKYEDFASKFGLGPKYKQEPLKKYKCPSCNKENAIHKEIHPDTDMNEMVLSCPDCGHEV